MQSLSVAMYGFTGYFIDKQLQIYPRGYLMYHMWWP